MFLGTVNLDVIKNILRISVKFDCFPPHSVEQGASNNIKSVITFLLTAAIPYCAFRILENANKKDQNNALIKLEEQIQEIYKVKFKRKPAVNTVSIFVKENGEKFYGVVVINDDQEPVLKVLKEYI